MANEWQMAIGRPAKSCIALIKCDIKGGMLGIERWIPPTQSISTTRLHVGIMKFLLQLCNNLNILLHLFHQNVIDVSLTYPSTVWIAIYLCMMTWWLLACFSWNPTFGHGHTYLILSKVVHACLSMAFIHIVNVPKLT